MGDHPIHTPRVRALFSRIARDEERVATTDTVSFEAVFTLEKLYRVARAEIRDSLVPLLELPDIVLPGKRRYHRIFALWVGQRRLSFADCYHAVIAQQRHASTVISFDRGFDRVPDLIRQEP
jgi:predicted nucleic acid-binding protein